MHFVQAVPVRQQALYAVVDASVLRFGHGRKQAVGGFDLEVVIAINTCNLLQQIGFDGNVLRSAPGRDLDLERIGLALHAETERKQRPLNLVGGDIYAGIAVDIRLVKGNFNFRIGLDIHIRHTGDNARARVDRQKQVEIALCGRHGQFRVEHFLIAHARVGAQAQAG